MTDGSFAVDLDRLDVVIGELTRCERALEALGVELDGQMRVLHTQWTGLAATAQAAAHGEWARGLSEMHLALGALRTVARVAHANYTRAAETNLAMWRTTE